MAVLRVSAGRGWLSPLVFPPKQSAIITTSRMLVLYKATQMRQEDVSKLTSQGYNTEQAVAMAKTHLDFMQEMASCFMTLMAFNGRPMPMDSILRLQVFGMKIRLTTNAESVIDWIGDTLLYGNIRFSMSQLRSMIHGMIASTQQHVWGKLMLLQTDSEGEIVAGTTRLPMIHWDWLVDNAAEKRVGWGFMEDPRSIGATSVEDPTKSLQRRLQGERVVRNQFVVVEATRAALVQGGGTVWVNSAAFKLDRRTQCSSLVIKVP
jgi:hypothetical protein